MFLAPYRTAAFCNTCSYVLRAQRFSNLRGGGFHHMACLIGSFPPLPHRLQFRREPHRSRNIYENTRLSLNSSRRRPMFYFGYPSALPKSEGRLQKVLRHLARPKA
jgi:hypothetical protein